MDGEMMWIWKSNIVFLYYYWIGHCQMFWLLDFLTYEAGIMDAQCFDIQEIESGPHGRVLWSSGYVGAKVAINVYIILLL